MSVYSAIDYSAAAATVAAGDLSAQAAEREWQAEYFDQLLRERHPHLFAVGVEALFSSEEESSRTALQPA